MKISVLLASRKNSKFLAKFLHSLLTYTANPEEVEVLVMYSEQDTWNQELIENFSGTFRFFSEDYKLGRSGLHVYFNELLQHATGDWIVYFCEDHCIIKSGWDEYILNTVEEKQLDPKKVYQLVPTWDNAGAMNQILSRGYVDALGNIGRYGNIDSYNNFVADKILQERIIRLPEPIFHDFTHDPDIMTPKHLEVEGYDPLAPREQWEDQSVKDKIDEDARILMQKIEKEKYEL